MKKLHLVTFVILTNFIFAQTVLSQTDSPMIGKVCPEFSMSVISPKGTEKNLDLSELRGKIVIMEFWATYCAPCIPPLKHFDRLQTQFGDDVKFIAISGENRDKVDAFIAKNGNKNITYTLDHGRKLNDMFYHHFIPHTVVIDQKGIIRAFCSPDEIDESVIRKLLNCEPVTFTMKHEYQEAAYTESTNILQNYDQPIIVNKPKNQKYKIELSNFKEGQATEFIKESSSEYKFINCPLTLIYQILFNQKDNRVLLEVSDKSKYSFENNNLYCLELNMPNLIEKNIREASVQHLESLFSLRSKSEVRIQQVFSIQKSDLQIAVLSADSTGIIQKSLTIKDLMNYLENNPQLVNNLPVINESGLSDNTILDVDWFQNYPDSIENRLRTLGLHGEVKMADIMCLILYEPQLVSNNK